MQIKPYSVVPFFALLIILVHATGATTQIEPRSFDLTGDSYSEDFTTYTYHALSNDTVWDVWQGHVRLAKRDSIVQYDPAVASDSGGNLLLVWTDSRNGNGSADGNVDIFAQKLDGNGNQLWVNDVQVNGDSGIANQQSPAITSDGVGNLLVVWADSRNGNWDIYAQKLDGNGSRLWIDDVRVNSDGGTATQRFPTVSSDGNGNLLVAWQDYRNGAADIYAQKLDDLGNKVWLNDILVNSDGGSDEQILPSIASDGNDNLFIVWQDSRNGPAKIYAQKLESNGNKAWSNDFPVSSDGNSDEQTSPSIASDNNNNLLIVWQDYRNGAADIYAQKLDSDGGQLWPNDIRVNSDSGAANQRSPVIDSDSNDNLLIVWQDNRNGTGDPDIYAQQLDSDGGQLWPSDIRVNSDNGIANQTSPAIASDNADNLLIVWQDYRNSDPDIYVQRIDNSGNHLWANDVRVNDDSGTANQMSPAIASDNGGNLLLVWEDYRNGNGDIYAQKLDSNGNQLWSDDVRVSVYSGSSHQTFPDIASDSLGNLLVIWSDERNGTPKVYAQKLDTNGEHIWAEDVPVSSDSSNAWQLSSAIASDSSGNLLLVWADNRNGNWDIFAQKLDVDGSRLWADDIRVNSDDGSTNQTSPDIASDNAGNLLLVWRDSRNGNNDVYAQKLDSDGDKLWADDVHVNGDGSTTWQPSPAIASDSSGNLLLAWSDDRSGTNDVYAQKLNSEGDKVWANDVRVNSNSGTSSQSFPALASDGSGNLLLVWQDYRNGDADLYAQKLDSDGNKLWANDIRVNSDIGSAWQSTPAIAHDNSGNLLLGWRDYRNGNNDIYAQRLDGNGNKLWIQDVQVVYPDLFYLFAGYVESQTVDAIIANITYAELAVTAQSNGGNIQYYLTNNGGQDWAAVAPDVTHVFTTTGSDLRWRASLIATSDLRYGPTIDYLSITYGSILPPTNLIASAISDNQIDLTWTDNSNNAAGFEIERSPDGSNDWAQIGTAGANETSYQDGGLNCDTTYHYRVRAYDDEAWFKLA